MYALCGLRRRFLRTRINFFCITVLCFVYVLFVLRDKLVGKSLLFSELIHTHYSTTCAIIWSCIFQVLHFQSPRLVHNDGS